MPEPASLLRAASAPRAFAFTAGRRLARAGAVGAVLLALVSPALGSVGAVKPVGDADPATATVAILASVEEIRPDGTLVLAVIDGEEIHEVELRLPEEVPIRAQKKKEFDGRRKLAFADLKAGQDLRFTYLPAERRIVTVTVLKMKAT